MNLLRPCETENASAHHDDFEKTVERSRRSVREECARLNSRIRGENLLLLLSYTAILFGSHIRTSLPFEQVELMDTAQVSTMTMRNNLRLSANQTSTAMRRLHLRHSSQLIIDTDEKVS